MNQIRPNYDELWKEALTEYFEQFLLFFFPSIHQLINWEKIPESLDKELQRITALDVLDELLKLAIKVDSFDDFHQSLVKLSPKVPESNESDKS